MAIDAHLDSNCEAICRNRDCPEAVKQDQATGRWYITINHPGFNCKVNNGFGFRTEAVARQKFTSYF